MRCIRCGAEMEAAYDHDYKCPVCGVMLVGGTLPTPRDDHDEVELRHLIEKGRARAKLRALRARRKR